MEAIGSFNNPPCDRSHGGHPVIGLDHFAAVVAVGCARRTAADAGDAIRLRLAGAGIAGIGLALLVQQAVPVV